MQKLKFDAEHLKIEYVHYGCCFYEYDRSKFEKVKKIPFSAKPSGGFWASPIDADGRITYDWAAFCRQNEYHPRGNLNQKFFFVWMQRRIYSISKPWPTTIASLE